MSIEKTEKEWDDLRRRIAKEYLYNEGWVSEAEASDVLEYVYSKFSEDEGGILFAYNLLQKEFAKGKRCGVCGMTSEESKSKNYDCRVEC